MSKGQKRMAHGVKPGDRGPNLEAGGLLPEQACPRDRNQGTELVSGHDPYTKVLGLL